MEFCQSEKVGTLLPVPEVVCMFAACVCVTVVCVSECVVVCQHFFPYPGEMDKTHCQNSIFGNAYRCAQLIVIVT